MKDTRILDLVEKFPVTQEVFAQYDGLAGKCIMCHYLFSTPRSLAEDLGLDLNKLILDLNLAIDHGAMGL